MSNRVIVTGFGNVSNKEESLLQWYCAPESWENTDPNLLEGKDGWWKVDAKGQLIVAAPAKKDFWRKTYYTPLVVKDDGPCLFATIPMDKIVTVETSFTISPKRQFDQAGICVRINHEHWLKTGIEMVDGTPRLSCVVTNVYSDWSTQVWHEPGARIRVHILPNGTFVVEAAKSIDASSSDWSFVRIAHLSAGMQCKDDSLEEDPAVKDAWKGAGAPPGHLFVGVFACCPEDQSGSFVTFHDFSISEGSLFKHDADGNQERPVGTSRVVISTTS